VLKENKMGQARIRGNFEQRKDAAIRRRRNTRTQAVLFSPRKAVYGVTMAALGIFLSKDAWFASMQFGALGKSKVR